MRPWLPLTVMLLACSSSSTDDDGGVRGNGQSNGRDVPRELEVADSWVGDLSDGAPEADLDFLAGAYCVPGTEFVNFNGSHVYYTYEQDAAVDVYVKVTPERGLDVSLLVSQRPEGNSDSGSAGVQDPCETSLDQANDNNPGVSEAVKVTSIDRGYHLIIGVAGANGAQSGAFEVEIFEQPRN